VETQKRVELAARIFEEYGPAIRAIIRSQVSNAAEQEDLYQNLYLALVSRPVPPSITNPLAYLSTIIRNDVIDAARRRKTHREMVARYATNQPSEDVDGNPEKRAIREEEMRQIAACIQSLPVHEAKALAARYGSGRSTTDAAQSMQVKERTVSRYLCLALKRIRQTVAGLEADQSIPHHPSCET
jgi:RNA polymerase sigma factor (sigma-70 family)